MPGTIRVSVLEFMDLPNLSPSPVPFKVSMGRRHYEAWGKGDFSFPLTTLRDDVILVIQDTEGNEISRAGVQAKSIVEKGNWDDIFPLEGGGQVHLQFKFALSEDDRNRIRMMRETVLKRKHVELQDRNLKSSGSNLASSFYLNPELSDLQKCLLQIGDLSSKDSAPQSPSPSTESFPSKEKLGSENTKVLSPHSMQQTSVENDADRNEDNSSVVHQPEVNKTTIVENLERQPPHTDKHPRTVNLEANLFQSSSLSTESFSENEKPGSEYTNIPSPRPMQQTTAENDADRNEDNSSAVHQPEVNKTTIVENLERQSPHINKPPRTVRLEAKLFRSQGSDGSNVPSKSEEKALSSSEAPSDGKSPSNVKKVISAFESSLTQDTRPRIKPTLRNTQYSVVEKQASLKEKKLQKASPSNMKSNSLGTTSFETETKHEVEYAKREKERSDFVEALDRTELSEVPVKVKAENFQTERENEKTSREHAVIDAKSGNESHQTSLETTELEADMGPRLVPEQPDSHESSMQERETQRPSRNSQEIKFQGTSFGSSIKEEKSSSKTYGGWIFPDDRRRLCATAGGRSSNTFIHREEMKVSMEENRGTSETKANEGKPEGSEEVHTFEGPLANVIPSSHGALKIAIMIGFGTLVLLTRQRKKKK